MFCFVTFFNAVTDIEKHNFVFHWKNFNFHKNQHSENKCFDVKFFFLPIKMAIVCKILTPPPFQFVTIFYPLLQHNAQCVLQIQSIIMLYCVSCKTVLWQISIAVIVIVSCFKENTSTVINQLLQDQASYFLCVNISALPLLYIFRCLRQKTWWVLVKFLIIIYPVKKQMIISNTK